MTILTTDNLKLKKGDKYQFLNVGIHLAPHLVSGYQTCSNSTIACRKSCLFASGNGSMTKIQQSRILKTKYFFEKQDAFMSQLDAEIYYFKKLAENQGRTLVVRPNLTSDIDYQQIFLSNGNTIFSEFPTVNFLDYTKAYSRVSFYPNYDLTYSYDQVKHKMALEVLKRGDRMAVVFDKLLPKYFLGREVVSGDIHDITYLTSKDKILGLRYKNICTKNFNNAENKKTSTLVIKQDQTLNKIKKLDLIYE